jgi:hypothetical protein
MVVGEITLDAKRCFEDHRCPPDRKADEGSQLAAW